MLYSGSMSSSFELTGIHCLWAAVPVTCNAVRAKYQDRCKFLDGLRRNQHVISMHLCELLTFSLNTSRLRGSWLWMIKVPTAYEKFISGCEYLSSIHSLHRWSRHTMFWASGHRKARVPHPRRAFLWYPNCIGHSGRASRLTMNRSLLQHLGTAAEVSWWKEECSLGASKGFQRFPADPKTNRSGQTIIVFN